MADMINQDGAWQENKDGSWSAAVPLPFYTSSWFRTRYQCWAKDTAKGKMCGIKFKTPRQYEAHYVVAHTDGNKYHRTPRGLTKVTDLGAIHPDTNISQLKSAKGNSKELGA